MFIGKPHKLGKPVALDGSDMVTDIVDLTAQQSAENLGMIDFGLDGNPDRAAAPVAVHPDFRGGSPQGNLRSQNVSGGGNSNPTAKRTAPMSNPFPAPSNNVRTVPSSIKK